MVILILLCIMDTVRCPAYIFRVLLVRIILKIIRFIFPGILFICVLRIICRIQGLEISIIRFYFLRICSFFIVFFALQTAFRYECTIFIIRWALRTAFRCIRRFSIIRFIFRIILLYISVVFIVCPLYSSAAADAEVSGDLWTRRVYQPSDCRLK